MTEYIILGHENPDLDSIVSGYLLEKLLRAEGHSVEFVIPDKEVSEDNIRLCQQVGINPTKYQRSLPENPNQKYILVDHYERNVSGEIAAIIDHHPTTITIDVPYYQNILSSSTAALITIGREDKFDNSDIYKAIFASMVDTAAFHSNKTVQSDVDWAKQQCQRLGFDYNEMLTLSMCPTDISNLKEASLNGLKKYTLHNHQIASSFLHLPNPDETKEEIASMIETLQDYREENNYTLFALIVHDITNFKTTVYKIYEDRITTVDYDQYTSRGTTIIQEISEELKSHQKTKTTTTQ